MRLRWATFTVILLGVVVSTYFGAHSQYGKAPDWSITYQGKTVSSAQFKGKVLVLDFWATWCPPCRREVPGLIALTKQYAGDGLAVVGLSFDVSPKALNEWVARNGVNYTTIFANTKQGQAVVDAFQDKVGEIQYFPTTLIIDRQGNIVDKHVGYAGKSELERMVAPLLEQKG